MHKVKSDWLGVDRKDQKMSFMLKYCHSTPCGAEYPILNFAAKSYKSLY